MTATGLIRPVAVEKVPGAVGRHADIGTGRLVRMVPDIRSFPALTALVGLVILARLVGPVFVARLVGPVLLTLLVGPAVLLTGALATVVTGRFRPLGVRLVSSLAIGLVLDRLGVAGRRRVTVS